MAPNLCWATTGVFGTGPSEAGAAFVNMPLSPLAPLHRAPVKVSAAEALGPVDGDGHGLGARLRLGQGRAAGRDAQDAATGRPDRAVPRGRSGVEHHKGRGFGHCPHPPDHRTLVIGRQLDAGGHHHTQRVMLGLVRSRLGKTCYWLARFGQRRTGRTNSRRSGSHSLCSGKASSDRRCSAMALIKPFACNCTSSPTLAGPTVQMCHSDRRSALPAVTARASRCRGGRSPRASRWHRPSHRPVPAPRRGSRHGR